MTAWPGFPIRTSSDHGSFINSPRLIADYHVLLRLQMPRHPPFALRNLTHEQTRHPPKGQAPDQFKKIFTCETHAAGHPKATHPRASRRCSRPLCSSQHTTGTRTRPDQTGQTPPGTRATSTPHTTRHATRLVPQDPTARTPGPPDPPPSREPNNPNRQTFHP